MFTTTKLISFKYDGKQYIHKLQDLIDAEFDDSNVTATLVFKARLGELKYSLQGEEAKTVWNKIQEHCV